MKLIFLLFCLVAGDQLSDQLIKLSNTTDLLIKLSKFNISEETKTFIDDLNNNEIVCREVLLDETTYFMYLDDLLHRLKLNVKIDNVNNTFNHHSIFQSIDNNIVNYLWMIIYPQNKIYRMIYAFYIYPLKYSKINLNIKCNNNYVDFNDKINCDNNSDDENLQCLEDIFLLNLINKMKKVYHQ